MNNITITISRDEYDTIIKALDFYNESIKQRLADQAQIWMIKTEEKKMIATTKEAPWGFKKGGTPKKQPGRKAS